MKNGYTDKNTVNFSHWNTHRTRRCLASSCSGVTEESTRDFILIFFSGAKLVRQGPAPLRTCDPCVPNVVICWDISIKPMIIEQL